MRILDAEAVAAATPWPALADALRTRLAEPIASPPRTVVDPTGAGDALLLMPAWRGGGTPGGAMVVKLVTVFPRESPALDGVVVAFDQATGKVIAVLDGMAITNRRTAAAAALGSKLLARRGARNLLVVGTGALARPLVDAHRAICGTDQVRVWGRSPDRAAAVGETVAGDLCAAIAWADIIACATTATAPIIPANSVRPGTHLTLVGAFTPAMAEAEPALMARAALIYADDRASVLTKGGEVLQAIRDGIIPEAAVRGSLADLCAAPPARADDAITVFKTVGFAALDLIATELALSLMSSP